MKQKLLFFILFLGFTVNGFSQTAAYPPQNLLQCGNEVFNLTIQNGMVLGNQSPSNFTVAYFESAANANNNLNAIANATAYVALGHVQTIYVRVTNNSDSTFAVASFQLIWDIVPQAGGLSEDVVACDFFILPPPIPNVHYYAGPDGTFPMTSNVITSTMMVYAYATNGTCSSENAFMVTILSTPVVPDMPDVTSCDFYVLPALSTGQYYTGPSGTGTIIYVGNTITATQMVYIFASNGSCSAESSFMVTINQTPPSVMPSRVNGCDNYILPVLPLNYNYYTQQGGSGTQLLPGDVITEPSNIYIYASTGTVPSCVAQYSLSIEIGSPQIEPLAPYVVCDGDNDGVAAFDLTSIAGVILNGLGGVAVTFHETQLNAENGTSAVMPFPYFNLAAGSQTIFIRVQNILGGCFTVVPLQLVAQPCTTISGIVRIDSDNNGCTATDPPAAGIELVCVHNNEILHAYTNEQGEYQFSGVQLGVNVVNVVMNSQLNGGVPTPAAHTFNLTEIGNGTVDFCITPAAPINDVAVYFYSNGPARPGMPAYYSLVVQNTGNTVVDGSVTLTYDSSKAVFANAVPAVGSTTENTMTFNFSGITPYDTKMYSIQFLILPPPTVNLGTILDYTAVVNTTQSDAHLSNNQSILNQAVVNSYDPNDMAVSPGDLITELEIPNDLIYTVRFQNSGNAAAINVRIENTLDTDLDWSTFRPIAASHAFMAERNGADVTFRFNDINLPAESVNEPESHGFITYAVKPVASLALNDMIENYADIYFDFNAAITTNIVTTSLIVLGNEEYRLDVFAMYPNPTSHFVTIKASGPENFAVEVFDIQGKKIMEDRAEGSLLMDVSSLQQGMYFVKVMAGDTVETKKLIVR
jgi:uncharacterized repeat protein (TIGR01451 family)